jgi:hypothetical protein
MKVLIGCEESQEVCKAFRDRGHEAYSCDLQECSGGHPEWHIKGDVIEAIRSTSWGFIGLHPVCTAMTLSGNRTYGVGKEKHYKRVEAKEWTIALWSLATSVCDKVYMENPMGAMNGDVRLPKPQIIQPYYFGDEFQKTTCLWLYGLPQLQHYQEDDLFAKKTHVSKGDMWVAKSGKVMPKWFAETASTNNEKNRKIRSKTFPGIAAAMAQQWG